MARQRGFPLRNRSRRSVGWALGPEASDGTTAATGKVLWTTGVVLSSVVKATIVRIRGQFAAYMNSASVAGSGFKGAVGIGITTTAAFTIGATAIPGPLTELDWDGWMYHRIFDVRTITATLADGVNAVGVVDRFEIDSKAMRKFDEDMTLFGMIEVTEQTSAQLEFQADTRLLLKLT